jgi:hypothetical protein
MAATVMALRGFSRTEDRTSTLPRMLGRGLSPSRQFSVRADELASAQALDCVLHEPLSLDIRAWSG